MAAYASSNSAFGTGSAVVTKPSGLAAGDLMVAFVGENHVGTGVLDTPSGWTVVGTSVTGAGNEIAVFAKTASSGDAAATNFTFTSSGAGNIVSAAMYRITGTLNGPANIYATRITAGPDEQTGTPDTERFATGITPSFASSLLIMFIFGRSTAPGSNSVTTYEIQTSNPTWTERHDLSDGNAYRSGSATATRTEITDTGYFQITFAANNDINPSETLGALIAITDTVDASSNAALITTAVTVQEPSLQISSQISPTVIGLASSVQTATASAAAPLWNNTDKPSPGSIANTDKP